MSCNHYEEPLALYVEGDLPDDEAHVLESHLTHCAACRGFLDELRETQAALHSFADAPLPEASLCAVRTRTLQHRRRPFRIPRWAWASAASLALLALGPALLRQPVPVQTATSTPTPPESPSPLASAPTRSVPASASVAARPTRFAHSTNRPALPAPRPVDLNGLDSPLPLSEDDADQLAKAVVFVSKIERLSELAQADDSPAQSAPMTRIETADPNIVIYWELTPAGEES